MNEVCLYTQHNPTAMWMEYMCMYACVCVYAYERRNLQFKGHLNYQDINQ